MRLFKKEVRFKPLTKKSYWLEFSVLMLTLLLQVIYFALAVSVRKSELTFIKDIHISSIVFVSYWISIRLTSAFFYFTNKHFWDEAKDLNLKGIERFINFIKSFPIKRLSLFEEITDETI